jgi:hypothetical protein
MELFAAHVREDIGLKWGIFLANTSFPQLDSPIRITIEQGYGVSNTLLDNFYCVNKRRWNLHAASGADQTLNGKFDRKACVVAALSLLSLIL